jgi:Protein of unknown function (DUF1254)
VLYVTRRHDLFYALGAARAARATYIGSTGRGLPQFRPDIHDRFFVVEVADAYTTNLPYFAGTRASGGKEGDFALVGPDWSQSGLFFCA